MTLYLKYRPKDFDSIVWQAFLKTALKTAIDKEKTVWAYIFCWPRWTWKTSSARIFAKSVNCLNPKDWNPCLECENCLSFDNESLVDVVEIDAASHTWVDNIREIIEKSKFTPTKTKYKIYIIDEVHMLSKWAFNALLKTLEEPPKHVKFILATTEVHKVPDTVLSRCQRYDTKSISKKDIISRLAYIAEKEGVSYDEKSLEYIANSSSWALRNAISLFEQFIYDNSLNFDYISENLWLIWKDEIDNFIKLLEEKNANSLMKFREKADEWKNMRLFVKDVLYRVRDKLFDETAKKNTQNFNHLFNIWDILNESYIKSKNSFDENLSFEIAIMKIISDFKNNDFNWEFSHKTIKTSPKKESPQEYIKKDEHAEELIENKPEEDTELSADFANDLFDNPAPEVIKDDPIEVGVSWNSDLKSQISQVLKQESQKWILQMAINASDIFEQEWILVINPKNGLSRDNLKKSENLDIITNVLEKIWKQNLKININ